MDWAVGGPRGPRSLLDSGNQANTKHHMDMFWGAMVEAAKLGKATALGRS